MDIGEMVDKYLRENGYDGLWNFMGGDPCGCELDDLFPCGQPHHHECESAYKHKDGLMYLDKEE